MPAICVMPVSGWELRYASQGLRVGIVSQVAVDGNLGQVGTEDIERRP